MSQSRQFLQQRRRLRWVLVATFVAVMVPAAWLMIHAISQLKWEAIYQQQQRAASFAQTVAERWNRWLAVEQDRPVEGYLDSIVQPVEVAGVVGHFEINAAGTLASVPTAGRNDLYNLLAQNQLVQAQPAEDRRERVDEESADLAFVLTETPEEVSAGSSIADNNASYSQRAFSELEQQKLSQAALEKKATSNIGRVDNLASVARLRQQAAPEPAQSIAEDDAGAMAPVAAFANQPVRMDFALLESGHYVLYRQVIGATGGRVIQGVLLTAETFLDALAGASYANSSIALGTRLLVSVGDVAVKAYEGSLHPRSSYDPRSVSRADALSGTVIDSIALPQPLPFRLVFIVDRLPAAQGGKIVNWTILSLLLAMVAVFWLLYFLGKRQIELMERQRDFVAAVSHELKTPLTSIRMYAEMLQAGWADESKKRGYYDYIFHESERLSRLVGNVLQMAKLEQTPEALKLEWVSLEGLRHELQQHIQTQLQGSGFTLRTKTSDYPETAVEVDRDAIIQIFTNLVDNAVKFSAQADDKTIIFECSVLDNNVQLRIRDFGPGIPAGQRKSIFGLFYRTESELTRTTKGTGIGLALVRELAEQMGASIECAEARPGALFILTLPARV